MADLLDTFGGLTPETIDLHTADSGQTWGPSGTTEVSEQ